MFRVEIEGVPNTVKSLITTSHQVRALLPSMAGSTLIDAAEELSQVVPILTGRAQDSIVPILGGRQIVVHEDSPSNYDFDEIYEEGDDFSLAGSNLGDAVVGYQGIIQGAYYLLSGKRPLEKFGAAVSPNERGYLAEPGFISEVVEQQADDLAEKVYQAVSSVVK